MFAKTSFYSDGQTSFIWVLIGYTKHSCHEKHCAGVFRECNTLRHSDPHSNSEVGSNKPAKRLPTAGRGGCITWPHPSTLVFTSRPAQTTKQSERSRKRKDNSCEITAKQERKNTTSHCSDSLSDLARARIMKNSPVNNPYGKTPLKYSCQSQFFFKLPLC